MQNFQRGKWNLRIIMLLDLSVSIFDPTDILVERLIMKKVSHIVVYHLMSIVRRVVTLFDKRILCIFNNITSLYFYFLFNSYLFFKELAKIFYSFYLIIFFNN